MNPLNNRTFSITYRAGRRLKQAYDALTALYNNSNPNPDVVMIEVLFHGGNPSLEISVRDPSTEAMGKLCLEASHMINFHFQQAFVRKFVHSSILLSPVIYKAINNGSITIYHVQGSTKLYLEFANSSIPGLKIRLDLLPDLPEFRRWSQASTICSAALPSQCLQKLLPDLVSVTTELPQMVTMEISQTDVVVRVGQKEYQWNHLGTPEGDFLSSGQTLKASFTWTYLNSWRLSSKLARSFRVYFNVDGSIVFRFFLQQFGHLAFIQWNGFSWIIS